MQISIDPKSSTPLYAQIKEELRLAVATGILQPGDQVPRVRELATDIRVNPNTVARAYRELQSEGILDARQGSGTFVSSDAPDISAREQSRVLQNMLDDAAQIADSIGLEREKFQDMADRAARNIDDHSESEGD